MDGVRIGGLWTHKTKEGKPYLSGSLGVAKLLIFPNGRKEKEQHPDYEMFIVESRRCEQAGFGSESNRRTAPEREGGDDTDLPF